MPRATVLTPRQRDLLAAIEQCSFIFSGNPTNLDGTVFLGEGAGTQAVNMATVRALAHRGLVTLPEPDPRQAGERPYAYGLLEVSDAGKTLLEQLPELRTTTALLGWVGPLTAPLVWHFTAGDHTFSVTTARMPSAKLAEHLARHVARALQAMNQRDPDRFRLEIDRFANTGSGSCDSILDQAWEATQDVIVSLRGTPLDDDATCTLAVDG